MDCPLPITHCTLDSTYCNAKRAHNARCVGWIAHCGSHYPNPTLGFHSASNCLPFVYFWPLHPFSWCTLLWSQRYIACSLSHSVHSNSPFHDLKIVMINIFQGDILMSYISGQHTYVTNRKIYLISTVRYSIVYTLHHLKISIPSIHSSVHNVGTGCYIHLSTTIKLAAVVSIWLLKLML